MNLQAMATFSFKKIDVYHNTWNIRKMADRKVIVTICDDWDQVIKERH